MCLGVLHEHSWWRFRPPRLRQCFHLGSLSWHRSPTGNESGEVDAGPQPLQARPDAVDISARQHAEKVLPARLPKQCRRGKQQRVASSHQNVVEPHVSNWADAYVRQSLCTRKAPQLLRLKDARPDRTCLKKEQVVVVQDGAREPPIASLGRLRVQIVLK
jgi:hypothetical protein